MAEFRQYDLIYGFVRSGKPRTPIAIGTILEINEEYFTVHWFKFNNDPYFDMFLKEPVMTYEMSTYKLSFMKKIEDKDFWLAHSFPDDIE